MPKLNNFSINLKWSPSPSKNTEGYRIYLSTDIHEISYECPYHTKELIKGCTITLNSNDEIMTKLPIVDSSELYIGISAVDQYGNESGITTTEIDIDFCPPLPVRNFQATLQKNV